MCIDCVLINDAKFIAYIKLYMLNKLFESNLESKL